MEGKEPLTVHYMADKTNYGRKMSPLGIFCLISIISLKCLNRLIYHEMKKPNYFCL